MNIYEVEKTLYTYMNIYMELKKAINMTKYKKKTIFPPVSEKLSWAFPALV